MLLLDAAARAMVKIESSLLSLSGGGVGLRWGASGLRTAPVCQPLRMHRDTRGGIKQQPVRDGGASDGHRELSRVCGSRSE